MELPDPSAGAQRQLDSDDAGGDTLSHPLLVDKALVTKAPDDLGKLDNRDFGDWRSRYTKRAWTQISIEFGYLVLLLLACTALLVFIGYWVAPPKPLDARTFTAFGISFEYPRDRRFFLSLSVGLSGIVGGACFALKWLYHTVAKAEWNQDRILWRLIVPLLSGGVAVFVAMLVASGVVALLDARFFATFYGAIGAGWLIGYFSDNVLAALQNLARRWFGTVDDPKHTPDTASGPRSPD